MGSRVLLTTLALGALVGVEAGCVESGTYEKAARQLDSDRLALAQRDVQIRAFEWQVATLAQQLREGQQRSDALQRDLYAQVQQLAAANAALTERVKRAESDRAVLQATSAEIAASTARDPRGGLHPAEVRRLIAATDARNAQILEELARIERALASGTSVPRPRADAGSQPGPVTDVRDPWGFGSRK